jgi:hypothetical protein
MHDREPDMEALEHLREVRPIGEPPSEAVQPIDDDPLDVAVPESRDEPLEAGALPPCVRVVVTSSAASEVG